jgi:hypothetical protein
MAFNALNISTASNCSPFKLTGTPCSKPTTMYSASARAASGAFVIWKMSAGGSAQGSSRMPPS